MLSTLLGFVVLALCFFFKQRAVDEIYNTLEAKEYNRRLDENKLP